MSRRAQPKIELVTLTKTEKEFIAGGLVEMASAGPGSHAIAYTGVAARIAEKLNMLEELKAAAESFRQYQETRKSLAVKG
jgi:hypothetical protein